MHSDEQKEGSEGDVDVPRNQSTSDLTGIDVFGGEGERWTTSLAVACEGFSSRNGGEPEKPHLSTWSARGHNRLFPTSSLNNIEGEN